MIVLDEQLLGDGLEIEMEKWYRGAIKYITDWVQSQKVAPALGGCNPKKGPGLPYLPALG